MFPRNDDTMVGGEFTRFPSDIVARLFDDKAHYPHFRIMSDIRHDFKSHCVPKFFRDRNAYALTEDVFVAMVIASNPSIYDHLYVMNADAKDKQGNHLFDRRHLKLYTSDDDAGHNYVKHVVVDMPLGSSIHRPDTEDNCHLMKKAAQDKNDPRDQALQTLYTVGNFLDPHSVRGHVQPKMRDLADVNYIITEFFNTIFNTPIPTSVPSLQTSLNTNAPDIVQFYPVDGDECDFWFGLRWPNNNSSIDMNRDAFRIGSLKSNKSEFRKHMNRVFQSAQNVALSDLKKFYAMCFKGLGDHIQLHELVRYKRRGTVDASKGKLSKVDRNSWKHSLLNNKLAFVTKDRILIADAMKQEDVPLLFTCKSIKDKYDNYTNIQPVDNNQITNLHKFKKLLFFFSKTRYAERNDLSVNLLDKVRWYFNIVTDAIAQPPARLFKQLKITLMYNTLQNIITDIERSNSPGQYTDATINMLFDVLAQFTDGYRFTRATLSLFKLSQKRSGRFLELQLQTSAQKASRHEQHTAIISTLDILFEMLHQVHGCLHKRYKDVIRESSTINDMMQGLQRFVEVEEALFETLAYSQEVQNDVERIIIGTTARTKLAQQHVVVKDRIEELRDEYLELNAVFSTTSSLKVFNGDSNIDFEHVMLAAHKQMRMLLMSGYNHEIPLDPNLGDLYDRIDIGVFFDKRAYVKTFSDELRYQDEATQDGAIMQILTTKAHCEMRLKQLQKGEMFKIYHRAITKFPYSQSKDYDLRRRDVSAVFKKLDNTYSRRMHYDDQS